MSSRPWMPLYIGDYRADTTHLSAAQHGAYLLLIMHYWQQSGLPDDDEQLARIACMSLPEWRKNRPVIRAFFGEGWRHPRVDHELSVTAEAYEKRSRAGRAGNEKRWEKHRNAIAMGSQSQSQPHKGSIQGPDTPSDHRSLPSRTSTRPSLTVVNGTGTDGEGSF